MERDLNDDDWEDPYHHEDPDREAPESDADRYWDALYAEEEQLPPEEPPA